MFQKDLDSYVRTLASSHHFAGSILVARNNAVLFRQGYGYADQAAARCNGPKTIFKIGSVTKMFTAVALLKLQEQGVLHVHDSLSRYISDFPAGDTITLHHLLSMTSGIANYTVSREMPKGAIALADLVTLIKKRSLLCEPGLQFNYSNANYILLATIIEKVSGVSYASFIRTIIFEPLKMYDSYVGDIPAGADQAIGYMCRPAGCIPSDAYHMSYAVGSGDIFSTVDDLYLFNQALHAGTLLNAASWRLMQQVVIPTGWHDYWPQVNSSYGYGLVISPESCNKEATLGHGGGTGSFSAYLFRFVSSDTIIIVLTHHDNFRSFSKKFFEELEGIVFADM